MKAKLPQFVLAEVNGVKKVVKYEEIQNMNGVRWSTFNSMNFAREEISKERQDYADLVGELFFDCPVKGYTEHEDSEAILFGD